MTVPTEKAVLALQLLIKGTSIRTGERITGLHRDVIMRLLVLAGERCEKVMGRKIRNVAVEDVQCDEIWGYIFKREGHKTTEESGMDATIGDAYTFVAIERNTKLVINFAVGRRDQATTVRLGEKRDRHQNWFTEPLSAALISREPCLQAFGVLLPFRWANAETHPAHRFTRSRFGALTY